MTTAMMMERTGTMPGVGHPGVATPTTMPGAASYLMVPRCTLKVEKCTDGMKVWCYCDDPTACSMVQNLCSMLAGGMCSCCVTYNGVPCCTYHFTVGSCKFELVDKGCCFTCTSGDKSCCAMIQSYCDCLNSMMQAGCHCCLYVNGTPLCWGSTETTPAARPAKK